MPARSWRDVTICPVYFQNASYQWTCVDLKGNTALVTTAHQKCKLVYFCGSCCFTCARRKNYMHLWVMLIYVCSSEELHAFCGSCCFSCARRKNYMHLWVMLFFVCSSEELHAFVGHAVFRVLVRRTTCICGSCCFSCARQKNYMHLWVMLFFVCSSEELTCICG